MDIAIFPSTFWAALETSNFSQLGRDKGKGVALQPLILASNIISFVSSHKRKENF
jgi:hypothetical protein